jgi:sulfatase-modifying factor enzyme 1
MTHRIPRGRTAVVLLSALLGTLSLIPLSSVAFAAGRSEQLRAHTPAPGTSFRDCSNGCPEMVVVQQGRFTMGAPAGEETRANLPNELRGSSIPQHLITIRYKLAIARFDVTRDEYAQFVAETNRPDPDSCTTVSASVTFIATNGNWHSPGFPQTGRDPVVCVSWDDAQAYVAWLSAKTGHVYRLPTEAEWEYAARAGTTTARYGSDNPAELCRYTNVGDLDYSEQHPGDSGVNRACRDGYAFTRIEPPLVQDSRYKDGTTNGRALRFLAAPYRALQSDRCLVITTRSNRSAPFHGANAGSNPAGDAKSITSERNVYSLFNKRSKNVGSMILTMD